MDPDQLTEGQKQEAIKREMLRKSLDRCKVLNPLDEDYTVYWDKFPHLVSAHGEAVFPRYIAQKYINEPAVGMAVAEKETKYKKS